MVFSAFFKTSTLPPLPPLAPLNSCKQASLSLTDEGAALVVKLTSSDLLIDPSKSN
ncbi:MAG: hypothetical protein ACJASL_003829 [Paraglaciecola sp.]|jgi:hypothetical protein